MKPSEYIHIGTQKYRVVSREKGYTPARVKRGKQWVIVPRWTHMVTRVELA